MNVCELASFVLSFLFFFRRLNACYRVNVSAEVEIVFFNVSLRNRVRHTSSVVFLTAASVIFVGLVKEIPVSGREMCNKCSIGVLRLSRSSSVFFFCVCVCLYVKYVNVCICVFFSFLYAKHMRAAICLLNSRCLC